MKVINLWGSPGAGKSTTAAGVFYRMKSAGYSAELVTEYVKEAVWEGRDSVCHDQLYLLAKQNRRLEVLRDKVEWVISDSPLLLVLAYTPKIYYKGFHSLVKQVWDSYTNFNFVLKRNHEYEANGRWHTEEQSIKIDSEIERLLCLYNETSYNIDNKDPAEVIYERIKKHDL